MEEGEFERLRKFATSARLSDNDLARSTAILAEVSLVLAQEIRDLKDAMRTLPPHDQGNDMGH